MFPVEQHNLLHVSLQQNIFSIRVWTDLNLFTPRTLCRLRPALLRWGSAQSERPEDTSWLPTGISSRVSWWHIGLWLPSISRVVRQQITSCRDGRRRRWHSESNCIRASASSQIRKWTWRIRTDLIINAKCILLQPFFILSALLKRFLSHYYFLYLVPALIFISVLSVLQIFHHTRKNRSACSQKNWIKRTRSRSLHRSLPTGPERETDRETYK